LYNKKTAQYFEPFFLVFFEVFVKRLDIKIFAYIIIETEYPIVRCVILNGWNVIEFILGV